MKRSYRTMYHLEFFFFSRANRHRVSLSSMTTASAPRGKTRRKFSFGSRDRLGWAVDEKAQTPMRPSAGDWKGGKEFLHPLLYHYYWKLFADHATSKLTFYRNSMVSFIYRVHKGRVSRDVCHSASFQIMAGICTCSFHSDEEIIIPLSSISSDTLRSDSSGRSLTSTVSTIA